MFDATNKPPQAKLSRHSEGSCGNLIFRSQSMKFKNGCSNPSEVDNFKFYLPAVLWLGKVAQVQ